MSTSIKKISLERSSQFANNHYHALKLVITTNNHTDNYLCRRISGLTEEEAVTTLSNVLVNNYDTECYKENIVQGFQELRLSGSTFSQMYIPVLPVKFKPHSSCKMKDVDGSNTDLQENEESQCELKRKLSKVDKDSEIMKFFEDTKCSVCLSNYKEIVNEDLHIVVPSCGHPLCCKCADNILVSNKKECPICKGDFTAQSFGLMKFNEDLTIKADGQRLFL